jgi:flagellar motor protein MotB
MRVAYLESSRRIGQSQAAVIFWGLISIFFATAASFFYYENQKNETDATKYRDQVLTLQDQLETLSSQKDKLQASISETENELKTREEFLQDKEGKLAEEETQLEALSQQTQGNATQNQAQASVVRKFNDTVRKLAKDDTDVVVRAGRPVLRVPDSILFDFGESTLKPEGKALLNQIAQSLGGQLGNFELRVETFTDSDGENPSENDSTSQPVNLDGKPGGETKTAVKSTAGHARILSSWDLTGARAATLTRYFHDETSLPFQNIIVVPRADFQPIIPTGKEGHSRNRRTEITLAPIPPSFHPPDADTGASGTSPSAGKDTSSAHAEKPAKTKKGESNSHAK